MDNNQQGVQLIESEEDKKKKTAQSQPGSAFGGAQTSPTGAKPSPTGPVAPSAAQQTRAVQEAGPSKGTGFTGVGRYLQANVGSRLGEKVAGRVAQTGQQAATRLGQSVQQFGQQLGQQQQQLTSQQQAAQEALRKISSGELTNVSPEQQAAYAAVAGGQFRAPTGLTDIGDIQSQAQLAAKLARGTQTTAGRAGLLQQVVGRGPQQYTKGKSALDALILGQAGGELAAARRATAGLERQATTQEQLAAEKARQFGAETESAKTALGLERSGLISGLMSAGEAQRSAYEKEQKDFLDKAKAEIASGKISKEVAEKLFGDSERISTMGFSPQEIANLLEQGEMASLGTSLNQQQAAQIEALKKIAGEAGFYKTPEELEKAGTTFAGGAELGKGLKFDTEQKYQKKKEVFDQQKQIIDSALKDIKQKDPAAAEQIENYIYGRGEEGRFWRRTPSAGQDEQSVLEAGRLETDAMTGKRFLDYYIHNLGINTPYWNTEYGKTMRSNYEAIQSALDKIKTLGLTGQTLSIDAPKSK